MKIFAWAAVFAGLAASCCAPASAESLTEAELMKIAVGLGHQYDATYDTKDPKAMASVYAEDGVLVSPSGPIIRGRSALEAYYAKRFASGAKGHHITVVEVHVLGNDGYGISQFTVTVPKDGTFHEEHGSLVAVYRQDAGGWHMALVAPSVPEAPAK